MRKRSGKKKTFHFLLTFPHFAEEEKEEESTVIYAQVKVGLGNTVTPGKYPTVWGCLSVCLGG